MTRTSGDFGEGRVCITGNTRFVTGGTGDWTGIIATVSERQTLVAMFKFFASNILLVLRSI